jgi:hypothetical protein
VPTRARIARALTLGRPAVLAAVLVVGAAAYILSAEANRRGTSATPAGERIADALVPWLSAREGPVTLIANDAIEARPELLLAIERGAAEAGADLRVRWIPGFGGELRSDLGPGPVLVLLRVDPESAEAGVPDAPGSRLRPLRLSSGDGRWEFHKYRAALYLIGAAPFAE